MQQTREKIVLERLAEIGVSVPQTFDPLVFDKAMWFFKWILNFSGRSVFPLREKRMEYFDAESGIWVCDQNGHPWTKDVFHPIRWIVNNIVNMHGRNHSNNAPYDYFMGLHPESRCAEDFRIPPIWVLDLDGVQADGLTPDQRIAAMRADGFQPIAVVASSPANRQVWVHIKGYCQDELSADNCSLWRAVQRALGRRYGADTGSNGPKHVFRLPFDGFINHKYVQGSDGRYTYKYAGFESWTRVADQRNPPKSPDRSTIESWPEYQICWNCTRGISLSARHNAALERPSQSYWENTWCRKREKLIDEIKTAKNEKHQKLRSGGNLSTYLRADGSIDDSSVDLRIIGDTFGWYARNKLDGNIANMARELELCVAAEVEDNADRASHKNSRDYARRQVDLAFAYTINTQERRDNIKGAEALRKAWEQWQEI